MSVVADEPFERLPHWAPAVVATAAVAALGLAPMPAEPLHWLATLLLAGLLVALAAFDLATLRLPDPLTAALAVTGLATGLAGMPGDGLERLAGLITGFAGLALVATAFHAATGRHGLGLGDAKLAGAAGAWIGIGGLPTLLLWAALTALLIVLALAMTGRPMSRRARIPFGPFLALGTWLVWLHGPLA